jgi:eukaryotic-like serine/threonine-protein kinase
MPHLNSLDGLSPPSTQEVPLLYLFYEFELSEQEFCLNRHGSRVALEPRALEVLLVLVKNHGKLLSKSVILETVWQNTFVEDTTLTRIIAVLRKQLGDDPRTPKYIETVPTRGYRFIAPVGTVPAVATEMNVHDDAAIEAVTSAPQVSETASAAALAERDSAARPRSRLLLYGVAILCIAVIGFGLFLRYRQRTRAMSTKDTLVLGDFTNTSGDPVFDDALRQGMLVQLEQSPVLRLASDYQIRKTLRLMGQQANAPITAETGREVCQRIGGNVVLDGSISRLGNEYLLGLRARRCSTGEDLDAEQVQVARKEDVLNALSEMATRFRTQLGEAHSTIENLDTPLEEATTTSLDALKAFSQASKTFNSKGSSAALPLFQRATELDPRFAMAHVWLGRMYADLGEDAASIKSTRTAYAFRDRASERERFAIDVSYDVLVSGNLEKAKATCDAWIQMYPRDVYAHSFLAGVIYPVYGQYERAVEEAKATIELDPNFVIGYRNAALDLILLNRTKEAEQTLQLAAGRKVFLPSFITDAYRLAFLEGDAAGMKRAAETAPTNPWLLSYQAATLALAGRMTQARVLGAQAAGIAQHGSKKEMEAQLLLVAASTEALYGYPVRATELVKNASGLSLSKDVEYSAAMVLALTGESRQAAEWASDLEHRFPEDTLVRRNYVPTIQATLALNRKQPQQAIDLLRETAQFESAQPLHHHYIRGQALMALGQPEQASAEFRKITDHPGVVLNDPLNNLAQLKLAQSYVASGKRDEAVAACDLVLHRWKNADADLPVVKQAKNECAATR